MSEDPLSHKTQEIFMSAYGAESMQDAFGKMADLQFRMVNDDDDEEKNLIPKSSNNASPNSSYSLLESWLRKCSARSHAHSAASVMSNRMYNLISIPKLVAGGAAVALSFWATSDTNGASHDVRVAVAALSAMSTFLDGLVRLFRFSEQEFQHKMASGLYSQLCRKIEVNVFSSSP
ncbi:unnamed protein product [Sphacelaria rigidula]